MYDSVLKTNVQQSFSPTAVAYTAQDFTNLRQTSQDQTSQTTMISPQILSSSPPSNQQQQVIINQSGVSAVPIGQSGVSTVPPQVMIGQNGTATLAIGQQGNIGQTAVLNQQNQQFLTAVNANNGSQIITLSPGTNGATQLATVVDNCQIISVGAGGGSSNASLGNPVPLSRFVTLNNPTQPLHVEPVVHTSSAYVNVAAHTTNNNNTIQQAENLSLKAAGGSGASDFLLKPVMNQSHGSSSSTHNSTVMPKEDILASATHQLIHGYPPLILGEEVIEEDVEEEFDDPDYIPEEQDEGYRTNSSTGRTFIILKLLFVI